MRPYPRQRVTPNAVQGNIDLGKSRFRPAPQNQRVSQPDARFADQFVRIGGQSVVDGFAQMPDGRVQFTALDE
ncbi:hypothetical protein [Amycolatopsis tolypomycina]|uniref:hypothetical protein n=1 Tax=Amycolatopsis tolypomycina TaxID=208445 RepID=UPI0033B4D039